MGCRFHAPIDSVNSFRLQHAFEYLVSFSEVNKNSISCFIFFFLPQTSNIVFTTFFYFHFMAFVLPYRSHIACIMLWTFEMASKTMREKIYIREDGKGDEIEKKLPKKLSFLIKRFYFFLFVAQFSFISAESWNRSVIKLATKTFPNVSFDVNERRKKNYRNLSYNLSISSRELSILSCCCFSSGDYTVK